MSEVSLAGNALPMGWHTIPAGYLFSRVKRTGFVDEQLLSVYRDYGVIPKNSRDDNFNKASEDLSAYQLVEPNDLVINKMKAWQGSVGVSAHRGIVSPAYFVATPVRSFSRRFVHYLLRCSDYLVEYQTRSAGIRVNQWDLDWSDFRRIPIALPSMGVQEHIANFLDEQTSRIDALIAEKERLESSLKDIEEVTAFDLVVRGLKAEVGRKAFREPWLSEVPTHWELSKLRHIASVGNGSTPKRDNSAYWEGGSLPWLNSGSVNASRISEASDYVTEMAKKECHLPFVRTGSTVVALTGQGKTRGSASIVEMDTTINQHLAYISLFDSRMSDEYLCVVLTGMYSVLRYISDDAGSTKGALTCEQLNQFRLPIPPVKEQAAIVQAYATRTQAINNLRTHARSHIDRLHEYRSSLISAAVTGQLDINSYKEAA